MADKSKKTDGLLERANKRFKLATKATSDNRDRALYELKMLRGGKFQWDEKQLKDRATRPTITANGLPKFVRQVTGDMLLNETTIKVRPDDSEASEEIAEIMAGKIAEIEYRSEAKNIYTEAAIHPARCGWPGYFRVTTDYVDDTSFDQDIWIKPVFNPFAVLIDPTAKEPDGSDAKWFFVLDRMRKEMFEEKYPKKSGSLDYTPQDSKQTDDFVWYAEYWECSYKKSKLAEFKEIDEFGAETVVVSAPDEYQGQGEKVREREVETPVWTRYLITDKDQLEDPQEWPGKYSSLIRVPGDDLVIDGEVITQSVITHAIGPQKMINFLESSIAEHLELSPKVKYAGTAKQFGAHGDAWDNAHRTPSMRLIYDHDQQNPGPPQALAPPAVPAGLVNFLQENKQDMFDTTGIYPPSLGNTRRGESGKAIQAQQREGDVSTYVYLSNRTKAIEQCGRVLVDLIPKVIDNNRMMRIRFDEDKEKVVPVNQFAQKRSDGSYVQAAEAEPDAIDTTLSKGRYTVMVDTGPAYSTRRVEAAEQMRDLMQALGKDGMLIADVYAANLDFKNADKIAERLQKMLPEQLKDEDPDEPQEPPQPNPQEQAAMQAQQVEIETAQIEAEAKRIKANADLLDAQAKMAEVQAQSGANVQMIQEIVLDVINQLNGTTTPMPEGGGMMG